MASDATHHKYNAWRANPDYLELCPIITEKVNKPDFDILFSDLPNFSFYQEKQKKMFKILGMIETRAYATRSGYTYLSTDKMSDMLGIPTRTIADYLVELENLNYIQRITFQPVKLREGKLMYLKIRVIRATRPFRYWGFGWNAGPKHRLIDSVHWPLKGRLGLDVWKHLHPLYRKSLTKNPYLTSYLLDYDWMTSCVPIYVDIIQRAQKREDKASVQIVGGKIYSKHHSRLVYKTPYYEANPSYVHEDYWETEHAKRLDDTQGLIDLWRNPKNIELLRNWYNCPQDDDLGMLDIPDIDTYEEIKPKIPEHLKQGLAEFVSAQGYNLVKDEIGVYCDREHSGF